MKLTAKFNLVLAIVFVVGLVATALVSYSILQRNARTEVVDRARLMLEAALAMRGYTIGEIKPLLEPHMHDRFLPQTVPAYAATQAFESLRKSHAEYTYKEATLNPTNPRDRAVAWEADLVEVFRNHAERKELIGVRDTPTGQSLYLARPITIKDPGCLTCHSTVEAAPPRMIELYGGANGFGWKLDETVGAQIVSVPMSVPVGHANQAFGLFIGVLVAVFACVAIALNIMLRRIVITPVMDMAGAAEAVSKGDVKAPPFDDSGKDEIAVLAVSFNRMRRSLEKAMQMIVATRRK